MHYLLTFCIDIRKWYYFNLMVYLRHLQENKIKIKKASKWFLFPFLCPNIFMSYTIIRFLNCLYAFEWYIALLLFKLPVLVMLYKLGAADTKQVNPF